MDPERGIVMRLRGGLDIVLGPPLQLQDKLRAAAWVLRRYPTTADRAQLVYADVSAPAGPLSCHVADMRPLRGSVSSPKRARMAPKPRRMAHHARRHADERSCIVNSGLVALDAASPSELSERG